jgi:hypothetical protein
MESFRSYFPLPCKKPCNIHAFMCIEETARSSAFAVECSRQNAEPHTSGVSLTLNNFWSFRFPLILTLKTHLDTKLFHK